MKCGKILHTAFSTLPEVEMAAYTLSNAAVFPDISERTSYRCPNHLKVL